MNGYESTFKKLTYTPFPTLVKTLNIKLDYGMETGLLTKREHQFPKAEDITIPTFYIIPKLHKSLTRPPGRPTVLAVKDPLEKVGKYVDSMIKDLVNTLPSFVRDSRDVLLKLLYISLSEGALLVGIDVESLYTSIPHHWGITATAFFLNQHYPLIGIMNLLLSYWISC